MAYFDDVFEFARPSSASRTLVHFTVHMDETTPHAHFGFTPIKDGTLSWKNYFDGRDALRDFQNRYFERVGKSWGLERGETGSGRTHKTTQEMKREAERRNQGAGQAEGVPSATNGSGSSRGCRS